MSKLPNGKEGGQKNKINTGGYGITFDAHGIQYINGYIIKYAFVLYSFNLLIYMKFWLSLVPIKGEPVGINCHESTQGTGGSSSTPMHSTNHFAIIIDHGGSNTFHVGTFVVANHTTKLYSRIWYYFYFYIFIERYNTWPISTRFTTTKYSIQLCIWLDAFFLCCLLYTSDAADE